MKNSILTTTTASMAALGLAVLPVLAIDAASTATKEAADVAAANTATVYIVKVSGKGWGVSNRASLALKTQDGVNKILLSGLRATVVMKDGKDLDKGSVAKALKSKGLGLASFSKEETVIPESAYVLAVTGTGWADTNEKARVALEKIDNIAAAYVNRGITIHLAKAGDLDKDAIAKTIAPFKMKIQECKELEGKPF